MRQPWGCTEDVGVTSMLDRRVYQVVCLTPIPTSPATVVVTVNWFFAVQTAELEGVLREISVGDRQG